MAGYRLNAGQHVCPDCGRRHDYNGRIKVEGRWVSYCDDCKEKRAQKYVKDYPAYELRCKGSAKHPTVIVENNTPWSDELYTCPVCGRRRKYLRAVPAAEWEATVR